MKYALLMPAFPLVTGAVLLLARSILGRRVASVVATLSVTFSFVLAVMVWLEMLMHEGPFRETRIKAFEWIHFGPLQIDFSLFFDPLSIVMALFVTGVSAVIHLYSTGYMADDKRVVVFFGYLNLFVGSMLLLVLADSLPLLFLGWEGVGVCSYLLIGFWFTRATAATAAKKAFIANRIGDVGLLGGILLTFVATSTMEFTNLNQTGFLDQLWTLPTSTITAIALLFFVGAVGKSAQFPLFVWLPDAMEGPTPVSALIHAATMVTAGVYLMARVSPLLAASETAALVVAIVGVGSALLAAFVACVQHDIKRVLAYSTMSQLGLMFLAVGAGSTLAGVYHMVTHAFFKALLFLAAGSLIHILGHQDLRKMGGLMRLVPVTSGALVLGGLALMGIPPFAGFWSKDEVLLGALEFNRALWGVGLAVTLLTGYYVTRLLYLAVLRRDEQRSSAHVHESPVRMLFPLVVLGFFSVTAGVLQTEFGPFRHVLETFLYPYGLEVDHPAGATALVMLSSVGVTLLGAGLALWVQRLRVEKHLDSGVLQNAGYVDWTFERVLERPGRVLTHRILPFVDERVIDGFVRRCSRSAMLFGGIIRRLQGGLVRTYAALLVLSVVLVLIWALVRSVG